ncbi:terminase small subunit [Pseudomonas phage uligo]|uniref:Small terminase subunit n=1 Tax=Pseudomonas phage uligo TaxID=2048979 RepID=A0A2H4P7Q7_9CAUD|nr:terminase small subunit [Pseudomonas phage uligo]ATW58199.1 small terminase subunit [Pseudomonas phage uligo]
MIEKRNNKQAATEDELGLVHKLTTTLYVKRLQYMLKLLDEGATIDMVFDDKVIKDAGAWAADKNGITCAAPEADEETELAKSLAKLREQQGGKGARASGSDSNVHFLDGEERNRG